MPNSANAITALIENAIEAASREINNQAGRSFIPFVKTNLYDTPGDIELCLKDDLLEVLTLTNGDTTVITSGEYRLWPYNLYPKASIILRPSSTIAWQNSTTDYTQAAISVAGIYAFHGDYDRAWGTGSTTGSAVGDTTGSSVVVSGSSNFDPGDIIRIDNELMLLVSGSGTTLGVERGWNGSTAATHAISTAARIWKAQPDIVRACLIQAARLYRRNEAVFGTTGGGEMGVQPIALPMLDPDVQRIVDVYRLRF
jgi:hypothetical protein